MSHDTQGDNCSRAISCLSINDLPIMLKSKDDEVRSKEISGLTHECGVFGCIAAGDWPSQIDVSQVICLGKLTKRILNVKSSRMMLWYFFNRFNCSTT